MSGVLSEEGTVGALRPTEPAELVRRHRGRVLRLATRLTGNRSDAEDLTQEVFVRALASADTLRPDGVEGWLHRVTTNLFLDHARRRARTRVDPWGDHLEARVRPAEAADTALLGETFESDVEGALTSLAAPVRAVVVMVDLEGLSYAEAASVLDLKVGTVRSRLHRGRSQLRRALAHRDPTRHAAGRCPGAARPPRSPDAAAGPGGAEPRSLTGARERPPAAGSSRPGVGLHPMGNNGPVSAPGDEPAAEDRSGASADDTQPIPARPGPYEPRPGSPWASNAGDEPTRVLPTGPGAPAPGQRPASGPPGYGPPPGWGRPPGGPGLVDLAAPAALADPAEDRTVLPAQASVPAREPPTGPTAHPPATRRARRPGGATAGSSRSRSRRPSWPASSAACSAAGCCSG